MTGIRYWAQLSTEQYTPTSLIEQAAEAERAGFDGVNVSDHFQPWWEPGESGHAWVILGAIGERTESIPIGTGVTAPVFRHNPAVTAQAFATLESIYPGRAFLGIGSGEALNEVPCGMEWPPVGEQIERMAEALEIIGRLYDGERLDYDGKHFRTNAAYLHTLPERRVPVYVSAFGPRAARVAAERGDGVWTLGDPDQAPKVIDAYRAKREELGKDEGEIIVQVGISWAEDDATALEAARPWKGAQPKEFFIDDWHDPETMYRKGEEEVSDDEFREAFVIGPDLGHHVERLREVEELGPTIVCIQNASGAAPEQALRVYGEQVLPALRAGRA